MKKSPQPNQENGRKQVSDQGLDLEKGVAETIVPQRRSVQSMQAINLEDTQEAESLVGNVSDTMLPQIQINQAQESAKFSQLDTQMYAEPGNKGDSSGQNSIDETLMHNPESIISSPAQINVHAQWSDLIGSELGGCRVERILGQGGMGVVFKGKHLVLDIEVAIKCLPPHAASSAAQERFGLEARVAAKLSHPNVVAVYHAGTERGIHFIVMELIDGESLEDKIKRNGLLNVNEALGYCIDICKALDYAERQGVVHRDLKPGNILVNHDQVAKLADLGLVKMMNKSPEQGGLTHQGVAMGTPHYMAPEQVLDAQSVDHRADLYSLGCTLFQMVCGQTVFASSNVRALMNKHLKEARPKAKEINPELPEGLSELIERLLHPDPAQRPSSALLVEKEIYALFDQWATLPNPIILPSQKHRSRVTYHLQSLDLERRKNKKLSYLMIALSSLFVLGSLGLYLNDLNEVEQKPQPAESQQKKTYSTKQQTLQTPASSRQEQTLLLKSERAEQIAQRAMNTIGTAESRLIKTPQSANEYYWNSVIHRFEQQRPKQLEALVQSFNKGLHYVDVAEEIAQVSTTLYGPNLAQQKLKELLVKQTHPALKLAYLKNQSHDSLASKKDNLVLLQALRRSHPDYLPVILEEMKLLKSTLYDGLLPIFKQIILLQELASILKAEGHEDLRLKLSHYYYQDTQVREKILFAERISEFLGKYESVIKKPLNVTSTIQDQSTIVSVYPNGLFYDQFKSLRYARLNGKLKQGSELLNHQTELLEQKAKDLDFKKGNFPYNNSSASILQFTLPFDYKGTLVFELIDLKNQVNYIAKDLDLLTDHYQKLEELGQNKEWYNVPMKGLGLFVIGNYIKQKKAFTLNLSPSALMQFSSLMTSVQFVLKSEKTQKVIYRSELSKNMKNGTELEIKGLKPVKLKELKPVVEIHLKLKNSKSMIFSAPLWDCFQREPQSF